MSGPASGDAPVPYWRLSGFYFFYFAIVGLYMPYWPLYLDSLGLTAQGIGLFFGLTSAVRILSPNLWGWLADTRGRRLPMIRVALGMSALVFLGLAQVTSLAWLLVLGMLMAFFWTGALPQFEAATLASLGRHSDGYARIRIWGSIGFILAVTGIGHYLEYFTINHLPLLITGLMLLCLGNTLLVPETPDVRISRQQEPLGSVLRRPSVVMFLLASFLMQFSHAPYYTFYSLYLSGHGYANVTISAMWSLGVIAEVVVFLLMRRLIRAFGLRQLILWSLALATVRWSLIGLFVDSPPLLLLAQLLHAATFGVFHAAAVLLIGRYFPGRLQGRGQALYSSLSFGLGIALGSLLSGGLWESVGPTWTFLAAAALTALGTGLCWRWLERDI